jgi:hypothetical protein
MPIADDVWRVVPYPYGRWGVRRDGARKAWRIFDDPDDALRFAALLSKRKKLDITVHRRDGSVDFRITHEKPRVRVRAEMRVVL